jgi:hypothetical protein
MATLLVAVELSGKAPAVDGDFGLITEYDFHMMSAVTAEIKMVVDLMRMANGFKCN